MAVEDPVVTDADKYKIIFENSKVRVLDYQDNPGDRTSMHRHPDFVLYALSDFTRKITFKDGKSVVRGFKKGDVLWSEEQMHIGENIGTTDTHVVIVELKVKS